MLYLILLGFFFAAALVFAGKWARGRFAIFSSLAPLVIFLALLSRIPAIKANGFVYELYRWVPGLGIDLSFKLDGVSLLFALLISGIGTLVFWYTSQYLKGHKYLDRFYAYLAIFMSSMLGLVLSDNLISIFIFWELTSISSYFLIGFKNEEAASRKSALNALLITGFGGLTLLVGAVLLHYITGTYEISELLNQKELIAGHSFYLPVAILFFLAAFTKSAQFPFHFWLPQAMKAPTPVSTYLHSATMVKAGVYLLIRFTPVLGATELWNNTITIVGGFTMLYAAFMILFKKDLKEILAFSTVSALGIMFFLIGIGSNMAIAAVLVFILTHGLYKAALFLITGIIDHATGSRDVTQLSGLRKVMMPVAVAGFVAAIISGGVPPTLGFISKDLAYEATLHHDLFKLVTGLAIATNILQLYGGFMSGIKPFIGALPQDFVSAKMPSRHLWWPPFLLVSLGVLFGLVPGLVDYNLVRPGLAAITSTGEVAALKLWHGVNNVLLLSGITIVSGLLLFLLVKPVNPSGRFIKNFFKVTAENTYAKALDITKQFSRAFTKTIQNGSLPNYVFVMMFFMTSLLLYVLLQDGRLLIKNSNFDELTVSETTIISILIISVLATLFSRSRTVSLISLSGVGLSVCIMFVFYSAPDLAMTQFSVDTLTVVLFVLILFRLPKFLHDSKDGFRWQNATLATAFGVVISLVCLKVLALPVNNEITNFYAENAYKMAKGKNVVNVILVDFRGIDTLIESSVLVVAALGVYALIKISLKEKY